MMHYLVLQKRHFNDLLSLPILDILIQRLVIYAWDQQLSSHANSSANNCSVPLDNSVVFEHLGEPDPEPLDMVGLGDSDVSEGQKLTDQCESSGNTGINKALSGDSADSGHSHQVLRHRILKPIFYRIYIKIFAIFFHFRANVISLEFLIVKLYCDYLNIIFLRNRPHQRKNEHRNRIFFSHYTNKENRKSVREFNCFTSHKGWYYYVIIYIIIRVI